MSIGTVVTAFILLALFAFVYIALGVAEDKIYTRNNDMIAGEHAYSQSRLDAMNSLFIEWYAFPIIVLLLVFFWAIKQAIADKDTVV
jgi:hypothetical protein